MPDGSAHLGGCIGPQGPLAWAKGVESVGKFLSCASLGPTIGPGSWSRDGNPPGRCIHRGEQQRREDMIGLIFAAILNAIARIVALAFGLSVENC